MVKNVLKTYLNLLISLVAVVILSRFSGGIFSLFWQSHDAKLLTAFFEIATLFVLSFVVHNLSKKSIFPSFVVAIFFGMAASPLLLPILQNKPLLSVLVGVGATLILFSGGLETHFASFRRLLVPILSLSFVGLMLSAIFLSLVGSFVGAALLPVSAFLLLGAILSSTDPAAIIPVLKNLRFKNPSTKDIIISESALTDVTGTLLTLAFLGLIIDGALPADFRGAYLSLFSGEVGFLLVKEIIFGVVFGLLGWALLAFLNRFTKDCGGESSVDAAYFLFVPIFIFTFSSAFGGSGYLAAFVGGLMFMMVKHLHETENYFNHTIEGFLKPMIFVLLGALVQPDVLLRTAPIGILLGLIFMVVIRPLSVFVSLLPVKWLGLSKINLKDMLFVSIVRETGAIPAVLLVGISSLNIPGFENILPIGMWVILMTLIVAPPLTPFFARKLGVAETIEDNDVLTVGQLSGEEPLVMLATRGHSFERRLPFVIDWAVRHHIGRVALLLCLEDRYSEELSQEISNSARLVATRENELHLKNKERAVEFEIYSRKGFLQENIKQLAVERSEITAIFVGRKVLDFGLGEVKKMSVPLFFVE